jgi:glycosyltransferase involved in cell wall biosynthesis
MNSEIYLSVVIPVFNEEESLPPLCAKLRDALEPLQCSYEIIFVDDGSTDQSFAVIERLSGEYEGIRAVRFRRNYRKAAALAIGFKEARGEIVITMDADLQDDPSEIPRLLEKLDEGCDLVSGWKKKRHDPLSKTLPSRLFNKVTSMVSGIRLHDFNCGLKAYRREVCEDALPYLWRTLPLSACYCTLGWLSGRGNTGAAPPAPVRLFQIWNQAPAQRLSRFDDHHFCCAFYDHADAYIR